VISSKPVFVSFSSVKLDSKFSSLETSNSSDRSLFYSISKAILVLKSDPSSGIKLSKKIWPKDYVRKYSLTNLWKYNLSDAHRLIYTVISDDSMFLVLILDWFNHKSYEKKFNF